MFWPNVGRQYLELFNQIVSANQEELDGLDRKTFATVNGNGRPVELTSGGQ